MGITINELENVILSLSPSDCFDGPEMSAFKTMNTYCAKCDREVNARIEHCDETMRIRGREVPFNSEVAVCPNCGAAIADSRIEGRNFAAAYSAY